MACAARCSPGRSPEQAGVSSITIWSSGSRSLADSEPLPSWRVSLSSFLGSHSCGASEQRSHLLRVVGSISANLAASAWVSPLLIVACSYWGDQNAKIPLAIVWVDGLEAVPTTMMWDPWRAASEVAKAGIAPSTSFPVNTRDRPSGDHRE